MVKSGLNFIVRSYFYFTRFAPFGLSTVSRKLDRSHKLQQRAETFFPGGVNCPVRAFRAVGGEPVFIASGQGARLTDADGNRYLDYVGSWGPLILGHAHPQVVEAVHRRRPQRHQLRRAHRARGRLGRARSFDGLPSIEKMRFVSQRHRGHHERHPPGPRLHAARQVIVKFEGCYHGHADALLVKAGSGVATFGIPDSAGVPAEFVQPPSPCPTTIRRRSKRPSRKHGRDRLRHCRARRRQHGLRSARPGFHEFLRDSLAAHGALLIFDEVMTGFRVALRRCAGALRHHARTSPRSARSSAAACPSAPTAVQPRSWISLAARPRLPGRHAERQSAGHGRRRGHAQNP